jgi:hypothetical protein
MVRGIEVSLKYVLNLPTVNTEAHQIRQKAFNYKKESSLNCKNEIILQIPLYYLDLP